MSYAAPLKDMLFVMNELAGLHAISQLPGCEEATPDTAEAVLEENAKFCAEGLAPLNWTGDQQPSSWRDGVVSTTPGFKEAFRSFVEAGWQGLQHAPEFGGQGLPKLLGTPCTEMINAANLSFALCPLLTDGAIEALMTAGSAQQQQLYIPKMVSGEWTGTMNLTEPQAGSDLALVRSRAQPQPDGTYKLFGTKIYITFGEHDMAENIIHLVLARTPDAPEGVKGISLFIVPKFIVNPDGSLGERNDVHCVSIEHKLGIKASPTAVLQYGDHGGATGYLVGQENRGLEYMFIMMNAARFGVGMQGIALADRAYQKATQYAKDRVQSRDLSGSAGPVAIIHHPDVRRMLLSMRAQTEAARALALWVGMLIDEAHRHPDAAKREAADDLIQMLTPIIKAYFTDMGSECANLAVQTYGGHGFIRENGVEQLVRDARITQLYEGTNGIQALDLVGRKLPMKGGRAAQRLLGLMSAFIAENKANEKMKEFVEPLEKALGRVQDAALFLMQNAMKNPDEAGAAATDLLRLMALTAMTYMWNRIAIAAHKGLAAGNDNAFYEAKLATARFYVARVLPQSTALNHQIKAGAATLMAIPAEAF